MIMCRQRSFPTAIPCILLVASVAAQSVAAEPTPEARAHLKAGLEYLDGERYDEAYRELEAAYAIAPKPKLLANIGIAAEHLERDGKAIDAYQGCLDAGGLTEREAKPLRQSIERLQASIATVTLEAPGEFWIVDTRSGAGAHVVNEYGPFNGKVELRVRAGTHTFELQRAAIQAPAWTVPLHSGNSATHTFEAEPTPSVVETFQAAGDGERTAVEADKPEPPHTMSYVLWGTGAAGAVAASVFLLEANGMQSQANEDYGRRCPLGGVTAECTGATQGDEKAADWRTAALLTGAGALGAIVGGTILYLLDGPSSGGGEATEAAAVQPWLGPNGVGVSGVF